jgi:hypothetical protein
MLKLSVNFPINFRINLKMRLVRKAHLFQGQPTPNLLISIGLPRFACRYFF